MNKYIDYKSTKLQFFCINIRREGVMTGKTKLLRPHRMYIYSINSQSKGYVCISLIQIHQIGMQFEIVLKTRTFILGIHDNYDYPND